LAPGERAEILLDLQSIQGDTIYLKSFSSELPNGIYGAATVTGMMGGSIPDYNLNPLNGADYNILQLIVGMQSINPVIIMPTFLTPSNFDTSYTISRNFVLSPDSLNSAVEQVIGPFNINGSHFDMNTINETVYLNAIEKWRITNQTGIAHPIHIHDVQFRILNINGGSVPNYEQGDKDVVMVMPNQYVEFVSKFVDFADDSIPYMFHCHLLHHEDDGMMGSFLVKDTTATGNVDLNVQSKVSLFPNPTKDGFQIIANQTGSISMKIMNGLGEVVIMRDGDIDNAFISLENIPSGYYILQLRIGKSIISKKIIKY
jgi:bilirubin oxidase